MNDALKVILAILKGTQFEPVAASLEAGLLDGRISVAEGADLLDKAVPLLETFFPQQKAEIEFGKAILVAGAKYYDAKQAEKAAAAPPPAPAPAAARATATVPKKK